jgi:hypothetical protein
MSADSSPISSALSAIKVNNLLVDKTVSSTVFQPAKCHAIDDLYFFQTLLHVNLISLGDHFV